MKNLPTVAAFVISPKDHLSAIVTDNNDDLAAFLSRHPDAFKFTSKQAAEAAWSRVYDKLYYVQF